MATTDAQDQLAHWGDDRGASIIVGSSILMVATAVFVGLRLWAQKLVKDRFDLDDYLIIMSLFLCLGICANTIVCVHFGIGKQLIRAVRTDDNPPDKLVNLFKAIWAEGFLWALEIPLVKIAILVFYRRVFTGNKRWFNWAFWITLTYAVLWGIATLVIVITQCVPVPLFWTRAYAFYGLTPPNTGSCLDTRASQVPPALLNCIGDLVLLLLPFPVLLRLKIDLRRKLELTFIFGLGTFVLGASIVRLRFIWLDENAGNPTWDDAETLIWTPVECCVGVMCACIPCMAPLRRFVGGDTNRSGYINTGKVRTQDFPLTNPHIWSGEGLVFRSQHSHHDDESGDLDANGWMKAEAVTARQEELHLGDPTHIPPWKSVVVNEASANPSASTPRDELPPDQIKVVRDLEWSAETVR